MRRAAPPDKVVLGEQWSLFAVQEEGVLAGKPLDESTLQAGGPVG